MKNRKLFPLLMVCAFFAFMLSLAFTQTTEQNCNTAEVEQVQGYDIYWKSKPVCEYEYLGTVKSAAIVPGKPANVLLHMIKRAKKEYPKADAIILDGSMYVLDAVKYK